MVDAVDSKSAVRKDVWVRYPPRVLNGGHLTAVLFFCQIRNNDKIPIIQNLFVSLHKQQE